MSASRTGKVPVSARMRGHVQSALILQKHNLRLRGRALGFETVVISVRPDLLNDITSIGSGYRSQTLRLANAGKHAATA